MWTETARRASRETVTVTCSRCKAAPVTVQALRAGQLNYCGACRFEMKRVNRSNHYYSRTQAQKEAAKRRKDKWRSKNAPQSDMRSTLAAPLSSPGQHQSRKPTIVILHDPSEWPMADGALISQEEYYAGLRLGAFEPGTVFRMPGGHVEVSGWER